MTSITTSPLSLHDALPISATSLSRCTQTTSNGPKSFLLVSSRFRATARPASTAITTRTALGRSEEHTSELQSPCNRVCRLLLEKKKNKKLDRAVDTDSVEG